ESRRGSKAPDWDSSSSDPSPASTAARLSPRARAKEWAASSQSSCRAPKTARGRASDMSLTRRARFTLRGDSDGCDRKREAYGARRVLILLVNSGRIVARTKVRATNVKSLPKVSEPVALHVGETNER